MFENAPSLSLGGAFVSGDQGPCCAHRETKAETFWIAMTDTK